LFSRVGRATIFCPRGTNKRWAKKPAHPTCLKGKGWLSKHAKIYVEAESRLKLDGMPENWRQLKKKLPERLVIICLSGWTKDAQ